MVMNKYLVTIQAWVYAENAATAENIGVEAANYLEEANEDPTADPTQIQTCIVHKAPFLPLGPHFWAGQSCEAEIEEA